MAGGISTGGSSTRSVFTSLGRGGDICSSTLATTAVASAGALGAGGGGGKSAEAGTLRVEGLIRKGVRQRRIAFGVPQQERARRKNFPKHLPNFGSGKSKIIQSGIYRLGSGSTGFHRRYDGRDSQHRSA